MTKPPLILTLSIEKEVALFFNTLRKKYFPPSRNFIEAHLTLFHSLPNENEIVVFVKDLCEQQTPFELIIKEVVSIGKGVAYKIESSQLMHLHKMLQQKWQPFLSLQDRQKLWPHITVQNKVTIEEVKHLLYELKTGFTPLTTLATGMQLWDYLDDPWALVESFIFKEVQKGDYSRLCTCSSPANSVT